MGIIGEILGTPLGYVMKLCYDLLHDYGFAIILFTLLTKIILLPVSLLVQKNSVKMIKMKPQLDALKFQYVDDKDALLDAQSDLYKQEKYNPLAGVIPLLIQLPIIFGLIDVVYRPLKHILHFPQEAITALIAKTSELTGIAVAQMGSAPELRVMQCIADPTNHSAFLSLQESSLQNTDVALLLSRMQDMSMQFFGLDLATTPNFFILNFLFLIPLFAGVSALVMCVIQNKINVLQLEQGALARWGMTIFMIAFSAYFAFLVPAGVGLYWIFGNLFSIPVMYLVNVVHDPKKLIDYATLGKIKERAKAEAAQNRTNTALSKKYYHELCQGNTLQSMRLLFYSEQSGFYKYFQNIIESLLEKSNETIYYVTSDPADQIFMQNNPRIQPYYVSGNHLIALMMKLECKVVVMTTPDLEKYHIKRSKVRKNIEYIYVDHACSSLNLTYRPGALDYFDTIMAVSKSQGIEVREMEALRGAPKKHIVKCGYGLIDNMIAAYEALPPKKDPKPTLLIAPSWQFDNILDSCLDTLLQNLLCARYRVIVRPHPQYVRRFPLQMEKIVERYRHRFNEDFSIETDFSSNVTVYTADMVITDWSAIAFEFSFTTNKPTLFINTQMKVVNRDYEKIRMKPFDISARNIVGKAIEKADCASISQVVDALLQDSEAYCQRIQSLKENYFYNLGHSGEAAAEYIISRLNDNTTA